MRRKWLSCVDRTRGGLVIRVLQFNILADSLADGAENSGQALPAAHLCETGAAGCHYHFQAESPCHTFRTSKLNLDWEYRKPQILEILLQANADLICLQEVDCFGDLKAALQSYGFQGSFCKKSWRKIKDGSAVFWRQKLLTLVDRMTLQILPGSAMTALFLRLATCSGKHVVVCATHLKAGFSVEMEEHRLAQALALQKHLQKFVGDTDDTPIILAADLNAHHSPYALCTVAMCNDPRAVVEPKAIRAFLDGGFQSAYPTFPSFTAWSGWLDRDVKANLDYIFLKGPVRTLGILEGPDEQAVSHCAELLPNEHWPSDHIHLLADVEVFWFLEQNHNNVKIFDTARSHMKMTPVEQDARQTVARLHQDLTFQEFSVTFSQTFRFLGDCEPPHVLASSR